MKHFSTLIFLFIAIGSFAQVKLNGTDLNNLIAIGESGSKGTNTGGDWLSSKRSPALNKIIDVLQEIEKGEKTLLSDKYLARPSDEELTLWYTLRGINYNLVSKTKTPRPSLEVANEILAAKTDPRFMLDYYYYRIHGGLAKLFNDADLSKDDIDIEKLGFKDTTEKSIFYFSIIDGFIGGRFKVLQYVKNNAKIMAFSEKLPTINGKKYYYFTTLDFPDFNWTSFEEEKSFTKANFETFYNTLSIHFIASIQQQQPQVTQDLIKNSILSQPKYFKYSGMEEVLQKLYDKNRQ